MKILIAGLILISVLATKQECEPDLTKGDWRLGSGEGDQAKCISVKYEDGCPRYIYTKCNDPNAFYDQGSWTFEPQEDPVDEATRIKKGLGKLVKINSVFSGIAGASSFSISPQPEGTEIKLETATNEVSEAAGQKPSPEPPRPSPEPPKPSPEPSQEPCSACQPWQTRAVNGYDKFRVCAHCDCSKIKGLPKDPKYEGLKCSHCTFYAKVDSEGKTTKLFQSCFCVNPQNVPQYVTATYFPTRLLQAAGTVRVQQTGNTVQLQDPSNPSRCLNANMSPGQCNSNS